MFRFHSSTLKLLIKSEDEAECRQLNEFLNRISCSPFYQLKSKSNREDEQGYKLHCVIKNNLGNVPINICQFLFFYFDVISVYTI